FRKDLNWDISFMLEETLLKMRKHWDSYLDYIRLDEEFHGIIVSALDNGRVDKFYRTIREEFIRLGMMAREKGNFRQKILDGHMGIILPIREKDREEARRQLHSHLEQVEERLLRYIEALNSRKEVLPSSE
ncbi:MAG: FCD domain-containing protein, partial [Synergistales bacterium]|nr:FCD domain-containing protein [Synergistales bacterium]